MILSSLDEFIVDRLKLVKVNGESITVYGPGDVRSFGKTSFVCFAVSRISGLYFDKEQYVYHQDVFTEAGEEVITTVPEQAPYGPWIEEHGNTITGPSAWTVRKFPIPVRVDYQVDVLASQLGHRDYLELALIEALPYVFRAEIEGQQVHFLQDESPTILDDLEAPLFRSVYRYTVSNIWITRTSSMDISSITLEGLNVDMGTDDLLED